MVQCWGCHSPLGLDISQRMAKQTVVYLTCILVIQSKTARREIRKLLSAILHSSCSVRSLRIWFLLSAKPWGNFRASKLRKVINFTKCRRGHLGHFWEGAVFWFFFCFFLCKAHFGIINKSQRTKPFFPPKLS